MVTTQPARGGRLRPVLTVLAESALFVLGLAAVVAEYQNSLLALLLWNVVAVAYLVAGGWYARRGFQDAVAPPSSAFSRPRSRIERWFRTLFPVLASLVGLVASLTIFLTEDLMDLQSLLLQGLALTTMLLAWLLLHVGYARRYQADHRYAGGHGLSFPDTSNPQLVDFLYFALTLGTTFATSDVNVTRSAMRWTVMVHSVLGFLYNAVVLAVAFKLLTGA